MSGHAIATLIKRNPCLTSLDVSYNSIGYVGSELIVDAIERTLNIPSTDFLKNEMSKIEETNYDLRANSRSAKRSPGTMKTPRFGLGTARSPRSPRRNGNVTSRSNDVKVSTKTGTVVVGRF